MKKERRWATAAEKKDYLIRLPTAATSVYLNGNGKPAWDNRFKVAVKHVPAIGDQHPKILEADKSGNATAQLQGYYRYLAPKVNIPLAGTPSEPAFFDHSEEEEEDDEMTDPAEESDDDEEMADRPEESEEGQEMAD